MTKINEVPFLIIGGGIGGLAAALGVARTGRPVHVLEQASEFSEVGAGLQLAPNAIAVLSKFGLYDAVAQHAVFPQRLVLKDALTGKELSALDLGDSFRERYGYPYIVMHRSDLLSVLLEACQANDKITLLTNQEVVSVEQLDNQARVTCSNGSVYLADAVIGADGLKSRTRKLICDDSPISSHYVAYRGTIPVSQIDSDFGMDEVVAWIGPDLHLVQYPVRRKELYNQVVVFKSYRHKEDSDDWGTPEEMDEHFAKCYPTVRRAVTYINRDRRWPMADRNPIDNWISGRVALLGDAAHPMLQYLAQGACQAMEDAACLSEKLASDSNVEAAFLAYQQERIDRTARVQRSARIFGEVLHLGDDISKLLRNTILSARTSEDYSAVDWLYGHHKK